MTAGLIWPSQASKTGVICTSKTGIFGRGIVSGVNLVGSALGVGTLLGALSKNYPFAAAAVGYYSIGTLNNKTYAACQAGPSDKTVQSGTAIIEQVLWHTSYYQIWRGWVEVGGMSWIGTPRQAQLNLYVSSATSGLNLTAYWLTLGHAYGYTDWTSFGTVIGTITPSVGCNIIPFSSAALAAMSSGVATQYIILRESNDVAGVPPTGAETIDIDGAGGGTPAHLVSIDLVSW